MERTVRSPVEPRLHDTGLATGTDMPAPLPRGRTASETRDSADNIVRNLITGAGFAFDPLPALA